MNEELHRELGEIRDEIFRIKARQREYGMHDEWCQRRGDENHSDTGWVMHLRRCNCWLVNE